MISGLLEVVKVNHDVGSRCVLVMLTFNLSQREMCKVYINQDEQ